MAAQRAQDQQESAAQHKKLADREAQVQDQKSKLLHADVHSGVLLDRLREAARDLGRVGAEVQAMAAQVRDTNERLDEARIREAEMEKAHAAGLAVVQEALQGSQARAEAVEAQRVQAVADAEVLRQKLEEMESTRSLRTEEEAGQDGREKKQALEAALAAVETARCDAEKVRVQWRAAEEREARAATVVAELTKLVKDQREKILDAQRDGKASQIEEGEGFCTELRLILGIREVRPMTGDLIVGEYAEWDGGAPKRDLDDPVADDAGHAGCFDFLQQLIAFI